MKDGPAPLPPHRIERTRNRNSRAVLQGDTVVIRLARNLSLGEERSHIENLLRRMAKALVRERRRTVIDPFRSLLDGAATLRLQIPSGRECLFELSVGRNTRARRTLEGWSLAVGPSLQRRALHRFLWRLLSDWELPHMRALVEGLNGETLGVRIRRVRLAYASSQWGSCSTHGDIMLNTSLLFLPQELLHYVIAHELAHRLVRGHTRSFWKHVERACPDYERCRRLLRNYRFCSL